MPVVSVIIPAYNTEETLGACLDSVVGQTLRDIEVLCIDDGSTDGTGHIFEEYASRDRRIRVVHQMHGGLSSARNAGLCLAHGRYISFVDADDLVSPVFLETMLSAGADVSQCGYVTSEKDLDFTACGTRFIPVTGREMNLRGIGGEAPAYTVVWNKLWRRELFDNVRFPEGRLHEDEFITWRILWGTSCEVTNTPLYFYRQTAGSITHTEDIRRTLDYIDALEERLAFYHEVGDEDLETEGMAVYCYVMRGAIMRMKAEAPEAYKDARRRLPARYRKILRSRLPAVRKLKLTMRMAAPGLYEGVKTRMRRKTQQTGI